VRIYRGEKIDNTFLEHHPDDGNDGAWEIKKHFPDNKCQNILGLCKIATLKDIEEQGWSLNPARYVGVAAGEDEHDEDFSTRLETLQEELVVLNSEAHELEQTISENVVKILESV
jgi:type I restriction enzyme M protein